MELNNWLQHSPPASESALESYQLASQGTLGMEDITCNISHLFSFKVADLVEKTCSFKQPHRRTLHGAMSRVLGGH